GLSHRYFLNPKSFIKTTIATTTNGLDLSTKTLNNQLEFFPLEKIKSNHTNLTFTSFVNTKFGKKHTNKTGVILTGIFYDFHFQSGLDSEEALQTISNKNGFSSLLSAYTNSSYSLTDNVIFNLGVHTQLFTLNNRYTIEPRFGLKWHFKPNQSVGFGYGLHSRLEKLNYYFAISPETGDKLINKNLDFTKSHHFVLSYDRTIGENTRLKIEPYYQQIFNVPVTAEGSFSLINLQNDWFFNEELVNKGKGRNYGIDLTLEQYLFNGCYFMTTASLFNSEYSGSNGIWNPTRYNRNYLFNFLIGKEWQAGKNNQNIFGVNTRLSYQGGDRYTPINETESVQTQSVVFDQSKPFSKQFPAAFTGHITINYKVNKEKSTHEFAFKLLNATMYEEFTSFEYNLKQHRVDEVRDAIFIPNISYKIQF
ncbi:MAG TPA: TonB-dependent receptor, partial [Flavobacteriaceae bacterium]|nr:TonB-dependent receptor [Flavobacteriaceae bacterium]